MKFFLIFLMFFKAYAIYLTNEEKKWIKEHNNSISIGITQIPNQVLFINNKPTGFSIDLFKIIEKKLNIKFKYVRFKSWSDLINAAKEGKIDIVFLAKLTPSRLSYLNFTDPVIYQQNKIITTTSNKIEDINFKKVACVKGSAICEYLQNNFKVNLIPAKNTLDALKLVSNHKADATILEPVRASYYIEKYGLNNLYVSSEFGYEYNLRIASIKKHPILNILLNKAIEDIPQKQMNALYLKWGYVQQKVIDKKTLIFLLTIIVIVLAFSLYLYSLNLKLKKEIQKRHKAEDELKELNKTLEDKVKEEVEKNKKQQLYIIQQNRLALMGEMLSMIAHQWRQPLNSLMLLIETLHLKFKKNSLNKEVMETFYKNAKNYINYMSQTIDDFRNFFKSTEELKEFNLTQQIKKTIELIKPSFANEQINIKLKAPDKLSLHNYPNSLTQALINILNNAKDALVERNIKNKEVTIEVNKNNKITISIEDNAGGIDEKIMDKIFDPYFTTKESLNGTGLGLYMSKMIVEKKLRGKIFVENTQKGAKFTIEIDDLKKE